MPMVWRENDYGGIRIYNFDVERFKAGQKSAVFPTAPAGFTYPSQSRRLRPGGLRGPLRD